MLRLVAAFLSLSNIQVDRWWFEANAKAATSRSTPNRAPDLCTVFSYLDEASARKLITNPIPDFPLDYDAEAVDLLIAETRCHPCLIQLTCSALVELKNKHLRENKAAGRHATVEDVRQALAEALKTGDLVFSSIWQWIPVGERKLLALIASASATSVAELARKLQLPSAETRGMVERLIEAEVLTSDETRSQCRFQVEMFRRWVERNAVRSGMDLN